MKHHTKWGSLAGLTVKRDDVTDLAPAGDLGLSDKSSFLFNSLLLMLGPDEKGKEQNQALCEINIPRIKTEE